MVWLKHMILALAAAVMTAGPAMSCCMPDHSSASAISEAAHDAPISHHKNQAANPKGHSCDEQSNITSEHHPSGPPNDDSACDGCADCTYMAAQSKVHFTAIQIKVDHEPEQLVHLQAFELTAQPPLLAKFIKPPATAPPIALSPVRLKQILIV